MHKSFRGVRKFFETRARSPTHPLTFSLSPLRPDRLEALSHFGCGFAAPGGLVIHLRHCRIRTRVEMEGMDADDSTNGIRCLERH
jgi:hypothetical protein